MEEGPIEGRAFLDVRAHLCNGNYTRSVLFARIAWAVAQPLLRVIPRQLSGLRNAVLRLMGAKIGRRVKIYPSAKIAFPWNLEIGDDSIIGWNCTIYCLGKVRIGDNCIISQGAHLCAGSHDYSHPNLPLLTPPIEIGPQSWICAEAFVGPGVCIGYGCIVGARSVIVKNLPALSIAAGNPARVIKSRQEAYSRTSTV